MRKRIAVVPLYFLAAVVLTATPSAAQTPEERARIDYEAAKLALEAGQHAVALQNLESVMAVLGRRPEILTLAAEAAMGAKDLAKARVYVDGAFSAGDEGFKSEPIYQRLLKLAASLKNQETQFQTTWLDLVKSATSATWGYGQDYVAFREDGRCDNGQPRLRRASRVYKDERQYGMFSSHSWKWTEATFSWLCPVLHQDGSIGVAARETHVALSGDFPPSVRQRFTRLPKQSSTWIVLPGAGRTLSEGLPSQGQYSPQPLDRANDRPWAQLR